MASITAKIPKGVSGGEELVVLKRKDFEAFEKWQRQVSDAVSKISRGRAEYRQRKTIVASSTKQLR